MSTDYITIEPYTLAVFLEVAKDISHGAQDIEEVECADGVTRVMFTRYGENKVQDLLEEVPCWSEHDDEFSTLFDFEDDDDPLGDHHGRNE